MDDVDLTLRTFRHHAPEFFPVVGLSGIGIRINASDGILPHGGEFGAAVDLQHQGLFGTNPARAGIDCTIFGHLFTVFEFVPSEPRRTSARTTSRASRRGSSIASCRAAGEERRLLDTSFR